MKDKFSFKEFSLLQKILVVIVFTIFIQIIWIGVNYYNNSNRNSTTYISDLGLPNFKEVDLEQFDGNDDNKPVYIGLNGKVYDVSAGREFYKTDGPYHYLAGRDSSVELNLFGPTIITNKYKAIGNLVK